MNSDAVSIDYFDINAELDANVGWRGVYGDWHYDLGLYYYDFPGHAGRQTHASYGEGGIRASFGAAPLIPIVELFLSPDYFFGAGFGVYSDIGFDATLPARVTVSARYGYTRVQNLQAFQYPNYGNWSLTATRPIGHWDLSAQLTDTTIDHTRCLQENRCSLKFGLRLTRNFSD